MRFRKKPVEIEARQWASVGEAFDLAEWCGGEYDETTAGPSSEHSSGEDWGLLTVDTLEGDALTVSPGDWIIRGIQGEFYPCKPDIFDATYEPAENDAAVWPTDARDRDAGNNEGGWEWLSSTRRWRSRRSKAGR